MATEVRNKDFNPPVRCKDCEAYDNIGPNEGWGYCTENRISVYDAFFCADGIKQTSTD